MLSCICTFFIILKLNIRASEHHKEKEDEEEEEKGNTAATTTAAAVASVVVVVANGTVEERCHISKQKQKQKKKKQNKRRQHQNQRQHQQQQQPTSIVAPPLPRRRQQSMRRCEWMNRTADTNLDMTCLNSTTATLHYSSAIFIPLVSSLAVSHSGKSPNDISEAGTTALLWPSS